MWRCRESLVEWLFSQRHWVSVLLGVVNVCIFYSWKQIERAKNIHFHNATHLIWILTLNNDVRRMKRRSDIRCFTKTKINAWKIRRIFFNGKVCRKKRARVRNWYNDFLVRYKHFTNKSQVVLCLACDFRIRCAAYGAMFAWIFLSCVFCVCCFIN